MIKYPELLHLMGGVDVDYLYYTTKRHPYAQRPNVRRDEAEFAAVAEYIDKDLPIIGVCRGAQLLCVANGGALWQHSNKHNGAHNIATAIGPLAPEGMIHMAEASHHQIMDLRGIPEDDYKILAWAPFSTPVYDADDVQHILEASPEVVWFPKTKCLAIQPHPEWSQHGEQFRDWADSLVEKYTGQKNIFDVQHYY